MQIELKRIAFSEQLSEETLAFSADVYINGYKAGYASNNGHGGSTDYRSYDEKGRSLINEAEKYCKSLPPEVSEDIVIDGKPMVTEMTLEYFIDNLIQKHVENKALKAFNQKIDKYAKNGIVYGIENVEFGTVKFAHRSIEELLNKPEGQELLKRTIINSVLPELHANPGYKILNKNIPQDIIDSAILHGKNAQLIKQKKREIKPPDKPGKQRSAKRK
ncbi:hypothetical protein [Chitinophaga filiformis]|uniref:Uncharacterized protein n=1 Tax=Chitinophaga filiformis TaxID=104663 RepID=A0ABY4HWB0_CHIFI|nr:hypothetical protein [Chitinophaga filiformis]UPK68076.1 hypothetical protein MYF79_24290 [Chitinophaga filiformis]